MSHYQMSVKALLSLEQTTANRKLYFWSSLKCSLILISLHLITFLSFTVCIPLPLFVQTRWSFILPSQIQISLKENISIADDEMNGNKA